MSQFAETSGKPAVKTWAAFTPFERAVLFLASLLCGFACLWITHFLGIPSEPDFGGSLLASSSPVVAIIAIVIAMAICLFIASFVASLLDKESAVFCCCMGLLALGVRCGTVRPVLQYASGPSIFLLLAVETALLAILIWGIWFVLQRFFGRVRKSEAGGIEKLAAPNEITDATLGQKLTVTGVQIVVMGVLELLLIQSDAKAQAMAGIAVAAFLGVMAAYAFLPVAEGIWYWIGPVIVGVIGYALAYFNNGSNTIGDVHGWSAGVARATPLDYAGIGIASALLAYWCSRRWAQPEESEPETSGAGQ